MHALLITREIIIPKKENKNVQNSNNRFELNSTWTMGCKLAGLHSFANFSLV
jgi:hypothetical protein